MDLHCHIDLYTDPLSVIKRSQKAGWYVLSVTTTPSAWRGTSALTAGVPRFNTALGLHPQLAQEREHELPMFDAFISETRYIGEIGLDGSKECTPFFSAQVRVFRHILSKCQEYPDKILTIHSRGAVSEVLKELEHFKNSGTPILHWFLGNKAQLMRAVELGCWFSVGPAMLKSKQGLKILNWIPKERLLLETDGPFTKGQTTPLEPCDSAVMIKYLANLWTVTDTNVKRTLKQNLRKLIL